MVDSAVLVLNRSFLPIHVTDVRRAFSLLYQGMARAVGGDFSLYDFGGWAACGPSASDATFGTVRGPIPVPRVILLTGCDLYPRVSVRLTRSNIFWRDRYTCQYCARTLPKAELNLDHVTPRVQAGGSTWENLVTACRRCNTEKGGRTPAEAGMALLRHPYRPRWTPLAHRGLKPYIQEAWRPFLPAESRPGLRR